MVHRRPDVSEYNPRYSRYIDIVPENDICEAMSQQMEMTKAFIGGISEATADLRYAPGKWSIREVVGHLLDTERIFGFRMLCFARGDTNVLQRADEDLYVKNAGFGRFTMEALLDEFILVRRSNIMLMHHLPEDAWERTGTVTDSVVSVRVIGYLMVGHERHHLGVIRSRYLQQGA